VSDEWYETLVNASNAAKPAVPGIHLVTAFRLSSWRDKGLPELLDAVAALGRPDIHVTVCGSGAPPPDLQETLSGYANCILMPELTDCELAGQLASADLFVLATRTRPGRKASGEGFGLVLLEAQIAGTPVIGPAHGGSYDAYIEGVTGVSPTNESPEALARVIGELLRDPERLGQMGARATDWARAAFAPQHYASLAAARLL
jgi:glycosyltransferase involved in cell wall biosynthesis